MITFTRSVGTAPGTTVLVEDNGLSTLGVMQCPPHPVPVHLVRDQQRKPVEGRHWPGGRWAPVPGDAVPVVHERRYNPYPTVADLRGGLGFVLAPWEINRTLPNGPPYLGPNDPQHYRRGEAGFYYDTPLGAIPTDAELGPPQCYTPVQSAWIDSGEGFIPPPYVPTDEWRPVPARYGPPTSLHDVFGVTTAGEEAVTELTRHQRRMFFLTILSTAAIVSVAAINLYRAYRVTTKEEVEA